jgi:hypothetical protein
VSPPNLSFRARLARLAAARITLALALRDSFSWLVFLAGGFVAVLFHNASRERRVQCNGCGHFFGIRTPMSKLSLVVFWFLIAPAVVLLAYVLVAGLFGW